MPAPFSASGRSTLTTEERNGPARDWTAIPLRVALLILLGVLFWLPRGLNLDRQVTPDEPLWLARSANFVKGLADGNLDQTYQYAHPGVTVMWAGAIAYLFAAPDYIDNGPETVRQNNNVVGDELTKLGISPLETMAAARQSLAIVISIVLALSAWHAIRLFGFGPGLLGAAILGFDPFHVALSRLLHLDGLLSALVGLAALTWLNYLFRGRRRTDLIMAGIFIGLAGLTRTLAVVMLPMILISAFIELRPLKIDERSTREQILARSTPVLTLGITALITFVALWPAMWSSPIETTKTFIRVGYKLGQTAHARPIFFDGKIFNGTDPGLLFYPTSFIWRTGPVLLIGLALAVLALLAIARTRDLSIQARSALYLCVLAATTLVVLDLSDKKLDRYIIPVVPPLAFIAGWGFGQAGAWFSAMAARRNSRLPNELLLGAAAAALLAVNVASIVQDHPYGLDYFNPLLGGATAARAEIMIGWGEGLDQLAESIVEQPNVADARIITTVWRLPIIYFLTDPPIVTYAFNQADALTEWLRSDYFIWYITPDQRGYIPPEMQTYFAEQEPVTTVRLSGLTYAALYDLRTAPLPEYFVQRSWMVPIAPGMQLVTATLPDEPVLPGDPVTAVFYLTGVASEDSGAEVQLTLTAPDGTEIAGEAQTVPVSDSGTVWSGRRRIDVPAGAPLGTYWVTARFTSGGQGQDVVLGSVTVTDQIAPVSTPEAVDDSEGG